MKYIYLLFALFISCGKKDLTQSFLLEGESKVTFKAAQDVACLTKEWLPHWVKITGKDVYKIRQEEIDYCSFPYTEQSRIRIGLMNNYQEMLDTNSDGFFQTRRNSIYFYPKEAHAQENPTTEHVGYTQNLRRDFLPYYFNAATEKSNLAAITIGTTTSIIKRVLVEKENANLKEMSWREHKTVFSSDENRKQTYLNSVAHYAAYENSNSIVMNSVETQEVKFLRTPEVYEKISISQRGLYALTGKSLYFFDSEGKRSEVLNFLDQPKWIYLKHMIGNSYGVYLNYRKFEDQKIVFSFLENSGKEMILYEYEHPEDESDMKGNDTGLFIYGRNSSGLTSWQYFELENTK